MEDEHTIALRNKVAELKERLNQIYAQSFADASKTKAFEAEFSLFLKSCEHARAERTDSMRLQNNTVLAGLSLFAVASVLSIYFFTAHIFFGMLILLGFGFIGCGLLFLLLAGQIRIARAEGFCSDLETYFKEKRWAMEQNEKLGLPSMPMWEEYRRQWNRDSFTVGPYGARALYAPFRLAITFIDLMALVYVFLHYTSQGPIPWPFFIACAIAWLLSISAQMLMVQTVLYKVDSRLRRGDDEGRRGTEPFGIDFFPGSWINVLKLFFLSDIISPGKPVPSVTTTRT